MRSKNSAKNLISSIGITVVITCLGFFSRRIFVDAIGIEYLGINGLLQNIIGAMALLEGGFATSVVYNLYKPLAENDQPKIIALLQLYKKVYRYIAFGIFLCALILYPFIGYFIKETDNLPNLSIIYFLFLFNSLLQYFTAYKWAIINASQQLYKLTTINLIYQIGLYLAKIAIIIYTKDYILYLIVEGVFGIFLNISIVQKANKLFPYIKTSTKYSIDLLTKQNIKTNMKALFLHSIGGYFMHSTDNIIISSFIGIGVVGIYSNYTLIFTTIGSLVNQALNSMAESVGNLIATESSEKIYNVFKTVFFINFLTVSIPSIIIYNTIDPFMSWWIGKYFLLPKLTIAIILINFFITYMRNSALIFKTKSGIFVKDRYTPLLQGVINVILSLLLVKYFGLNGVFIATCISILAIGFWQFPRLIYKYTFKKSLLTYFKTYLFYLSAALCALIVSSIVCNIISLDNNLLKCFVNFFISLFCIVIIYLITFFRTSEFDKILNYIRIVLFNQ